jgi:hypothetical protein
MAPAVGVAMVSCVPGELGGPRDRLVGPAGRTPLGRQWLAAGRLHTNQASASQERKMLAGLSCWPMSFTAETVIAHPRQARRKNAGRSQRKRNLDRTALASRVNPDLRPKIEEIISKARHFW